jgi:hypothetical protein
MTSTRPAKVRVPSGARRPVQRFDPALLQTETEFQGAVMHLAQLRGWHLPTRNVEIELPGIAFHPRVMYRSEPGWPDLTLVRRKDRRLLFAELKTDKKTSVLSPRQEQVLDLLRAACAFEPPVRFRVDGELVPLVQVRVWRPSDWAEIERVLA